MTVNSARRGWGRWSRSLVLTALLAAGTACGGGGDRAAEGHGATIGRAGETQAATGQQQPAGQPQVFPTPLGDRPAGETGRATAERLLSQGAPPVPAASVPDLGIGRPHVPPNTVSLETLHQQGRTHVLR